MYDHRNGVSFRKLEREDLDLLWTLKQDSWVTTHRTTFATKEDQTRWYDSIPANAAHFIASRRKPVSGQRFNKEQFVVEDGEWEQEVPVGLLSLTNIDWVPRVASIGGSIFADHRGTEWAKKAWEAGTDFAFEMFNLHRVEGEVLENNPASLCMDLCLGYQIEGMRRKAVYKSGHYLDSYVFGLLRSEWEASAIQRYAGICNTNYRRRRAASKVLERAKVQVPTYLPEDVLTDEVLPVDPAPRQVKVNPQPCLGRSSEEFHQAVS